MSTNVNSPTSMDYMGVEETMVIFGNLSPKTCAKMITVAVDNEREIVDKLILSPEHSSLIQQHQTIQSLTTNCPERAQALKELACEKYIVNKRQDINPRKEPARVLSFDNKIPISERKRPAIVTKKRKMISTNSTVRDHTLPNKEKKRKNIKWKTVRREEFPTLSLCKTHIRENYSTLKVKETKTTNNLITTKYQCFENSNNKKSGRNSHLYQIR